MGIYNVYFVYVTSDYTSVLHHSVWHEAFNLKVFSLTYCRLVLLAWKTPDLCTINKAISEHYRC